MTITQYLEEEKELLKAGEYTYTKARADGIAVFGLSINVFKLRIILYSTYKLNVYEKAVIRNYQIALNLKQRYEVEIIRVKTPKVKQTKRVKIKHFKG